MPARTERGNTRGSATLKRKIACTLLSINLHFLVHLWSRNCVKCLCARGQTGCDAWFTMLQKFTPLSTQKYRILFSRSGSLIDNFLGKCFVCCQSQTQGFCISKVQDPVQQIREFDWQFLGKMFCLLSISNSRILHFKSTGSCSADPGVWLTIFWEISWERGSKHYSVV